MQKCNKRGTWIKNCGVRFLPEVRSQSVLFTLYCTIHIGNNLGLTGARVQVRRLVNLTQIRTMRVKSRLGTRKCDKSKAGPTSTKKRLIFKSGRPPTYSSFGRSGWESRKASGIPRWPITLCFRWLPYFCQQAPRRVGCRYQTSCNCWWGGGKQGLCTGVGILKFYFQTRTHPTDWSMIVVRIPIL